MTLKTPGPYMTGLPPFGPDSLEVEIAAERAASLGFAGRRVAESLAALAACSGPPELHHTLAKEAAEAVWAYFVQRETVGFRAHDDAIREYGIPPEVLALVGST